MKLQLKSSICSTSGSSRWTTVEYLKKLVDSLPRRLEEVIARQGAFTKY
jgi:hypothetical protein